jgi:hypothetical protein
MMSERKATIVLYSLVIGAVALFAGGVWAIVEYQDRQVKVRIDKFEKDFEESLDKSLKKRNERIESATKEELRRREEERRWNIEHFGNPRGNWIPVDFGGDPGMLPMDSGESK